MRALLDINVLLALLDRDHIQHEQGRRWFQQQVYHGWASCAVTQNGFIRILSQPSYPGPRSHLAGDTTSGHGYFDRASRYWGSEVSILDETIFNHSRIHGPRQLTDVYLLGLAAHHGEAPRHLRSDDRAGAVRTASPNNLVVL